MFLSVNQSKFYSANIAGDIILNTRGYPPGCGRNQGHGLSRESPMDRSWPFTATHMYSNTKQVERRSSTKGQLSGKTFVHVFIGQSCTRTTLSERTVYYFALAAVGIDHHACIQWEGRQCSHRHTGDVFRRIIYQSPDMLLCTSGQKRI